MTTYKRILPAALLALTAACAGPIERADEYVSQDEWMKAVLEYRKAQASYPKDIEYRSRLKQTELKAADYYYQRGLRALEQGNLDNAVLFYQQGLTAMPDHDKLQNAMKEVLTRKEADRLYQEGRLLQEAGKPDDAILKFRRAYQINPNHRDAAAIVAAIEKEEKIHASEGLALGSNTPVTLNFRQTELKTAFEFLAKSFGVNIIFDESFKSVPVTLFAKDVTFEQGLSLLINTTKTFYKKIGPNTILVSPDTKEKRGQYEDYLVHNFRLSNVKAKDMADMLKGVLSVKKIVVNEQLNTITIRDTVDVVRLAERIISNNDKMPAEIIMEVEILEINRNKAEKIGLDLGTYSISATVQPFPIASGAFETALNTNSALTLPTSTLRFFKQDVDAKTLANPKIRVINGKAAKIHIGDRVPLRAATIVDSTGQTRTTYDYKDIGIRLNAEPTINLDNTATVKLALEVSSLGANLGTDKEPAYSIGTRNAETYMVLRDGETAILGGLIRDEERNTKVRIPGLGDIPLAGTVFTSFDNSGGRTDVLLTITPRVVRSWELPAKSSNEFYSGSENVLLNKPLFASLDAPATSSTGVVAKPKIEVGSPAASSAAASASSTGTAGGAPSVPESAAAPPPAGPAPGAQPSQPSAQPAPASLSPMLTFSESVYEVNAGQDKEVRIVGQGLGGITTLPMEVLYNPQLLTFLRGEQGDPAPQSFSANADAGKGTLQVNVTYDAATAPKDSATLARIVLRGTKPGVSYLVFRTPALTSATGEPINAQSRATRIVVK